MAIHNTSYDAANTAVRAFLTEVGAKYWGRSFNTGSGPGKEVWLKIKKDVFNGKCCYCRKPSDKLQIEHLIMFNREQYGLHHPGNIAPVCSECNKRGKDTNGRHTIWEEHLKNICMRNNNSKNFMIIHTHILKHIQEGEFAYPKLTKNEKHCIRVIAEYLYHNIKTITDNSLVLYGKITDAFVNKKTKKY